MEFLNNVKDFFANGMTGKAMGVILALWVLGRLGKFEWYRAARAKYGIACDALGVFLDKIGKSKLGTLWNPIEDVICDWIVFGGSQLANGLRRNDALAVVKEADRLQGVGSENRLAMTLERLTDALDKGARLPENDPVTQSVLANMTDSAAQKTGE